MLTLRAQAGQVADLPPLSWQIYPLVKRVNKKDRTVAPICPLTGDTRKPEHVPQQPTQRQVQPHKIVVPTEVHAPMEPLEPEVPINPQKIDEPLDQGNPPPTPEESVEQETEVPEEPLQVPIVTNNQNQWFQKNHYLKCYLCPNLCHCLIQYLKYLINPFHFKA